MNTSDWIALAALLVAVVGTGSATFYARRSAKTAEDAAESSRKAADQAAALTAIEADRRQEEKEQEHRALAPPHPGEYVADLRKGTPVDSLVSTIKVPRGYRIKAEAIFHKGGSTGAGLGNVLPPNQEVPFHFENWPPGSKTPVTKEIRIRFWPPLEGDGVDVWTCRCGKPTGEDLDGEGHWEWRVPVVYNPPASPRMRYIPD